MSTTLTKNKAPHLALNARLLTQDGAKVLQFLVKVLDDPSEPTTVRLAAGGMLLDRGYGRAPVEIHVDHEITHALKGYDLPTLLAMAAAIQVAEAQGSESPALVEATVLEPEAQE